MLLTIFAWSLLAALLAMLFAPDSRIGKAVRETLVEAPARFLLDMTWAKAGRIALLAPIFFVLVMSGPEMLAMMVMMGGDLAAVELLLVVWAASVSGSLGAMWRRFTEIVAGLQRIARRLSGRAFVRKAPRRRQRKATRKPRQDGDEPGWAYA
jgi:hypothetical protein